MKLDRTKQKQKKSGKAKKTERLTFSILIGLVIISILYRKFLEPETIGGDHRFFFFIFLIPTFFGMIMLGLLKIKALRNRWSESKGLVTKILFIFINIVQGFVFSYLSFGLISNASWDYLVKRKANQNTAETISCQIIANNSGTSKTSPNIYFEFKGKEERISIDHRTYGQYFNSNPQTLEIELVIRKGIWNYYIVDKWRLKNKS